MQRFNALALIVLSVLSLGLRAADDAVGKRHVEEAGGFSFAPPTGWEMKEMPGLKYRIAFGTPSDGFAPNINVVDEAFGGTLNDYVVANLKSLQTVFKGFKKISQSDLKTDAGVSFVRLVSTSEHNGKNLRQTFYFFDGPPGKKLVVSCSCQAEGGEKLDAVFDASMKTLKVEKK